MQKYFDTIQDKAGNAVAGAEIYVRGLGGALAVIFADNGVTRATNPLHSDTLGTFAFYAADGRYNLEVRLNGVLFGTKSDILIEDPADASPANISGGTIKNANLEGVRLNETSLGSDNRPVPTMTQIDQIDQGSGALVQRVESLEDEVENLNLMTEKTVFTYETKAEADIAATNIPDGQWVEALDVKKLYKAQGGALVLFANLDQLRVDLAASGGSSLVGNGARSVAAKLAEYKSILDEGGSNTGANNSAALNTLFAQGVKLVKFPEGGDKNYVFGMDMNPAATAGMTWDVAPDVTISVADTGYLASDLQVVRPTRLRLTALNCDYWLTPQRNHSSATSAFAVAPLAFSDADFSKIIPIKPNAGDLEFKFIPWNGSDIFTPFSPVNVSESGVMFDYPTTNAFCLGMRFMKPGDELTARYDAATGTSQFVVALVHTTAGIHGVYAPVGVASTPDFFEKLVGQAARTSNIVAAPLGTHQSYNGEFALWSVRVNTMTNFSILLSGMEVLNYTVPGEILECGLGSLAVAGGQQSFIQDWTLTQNKIDGGKKATNIAVFGDSRADDNMPDTWPRWTRKYLDGWRGMRVHRIDNYAIAGQNAYQQSLLCTPANIAAADIVVIDIGTNDIQGFTDEGAYYSTVKGMVQTCITAGKKVILGLPDQFYGRGQAGAGIGQNTSRYGEGKFIRSKCLRLAADMGVKIVDKQQCLGAIMAQYINQTIPPNIAGLHLDPVVYDNIHFTAFGQQLIGAAYARAIAGEVIKDRTLPLVKPPALVPPDTLMNGWTATLQPLKWWRGADGMVSMGGVVQCGTKADSTVICKLPENMRPVDTVRIPVITDQGTMVMLLLDPSGVILVYGVGASINWLSVDGVRFPTKLF